MLLNILLTQPRPPLTFFFLQLANIHPFINRKTVTQTIKLLLILTCLAKCNLALESFPELIPPSLPTSPCARSATAGLLALCLYSGMLSLSYYCPLPPLWREETPLFFHFMIRCLTHTRHSRIAFKILNIIYVCEIYNNNERVICQLDLLMKPGL